MSPLASETTINKAPPMPWVVGAADSLCGPVAARQSIPPVDEVVEEALNTPLAQKAAVTGRQSGLRPTRRKLSVAAAASRPYLLAPAS